MIIQEKSRFEALNEMLQRQYVLGKQIRELDKDLVDGIKKGTLTSGQPRTDYAHAVLGLGTDIAAREKFFVEADTLQTYLKSYVGQWLVWYGVERQTSGMFPLITQLLAGIIVDKPIEWNAHAGYCRLPVPKTIEYTPPPADSLNDPRVYETEGLYYNGFIDLDKPGEPNPTVMKPLVIGNEALGCWIRQDPDRPGIMYDVITRFGADPHTIPVLKGFVVEEQTRLVEKAQMLLPKLRRKSLDVATRVHLTHLRQWARRIGFDTDSRIQQALRYLPI